MTPDNIQVVPHDDAKDTSTFDLRISFSGLCLFVPVAGSPATIQVLVPKVAGHHNVPAHSALLLHGDGSVDPGQDTSGPEPLFQPLKAELNVGGLGNHQVGGALDISVTNLSHITGRRVRRELLDSTLHADLAARITLREGTATEYGKGARWAICCSEREMTHVVHWDIKELRGKAVTVPVSGPKSSVTLFPKNGRVDFWVLNIPYNERPTTYPPVDQSTGKQPTADHFMELYKLLEPGTFQPRAYFIEPPLSPLVQEEKIVGISPLTCMTGGGG